MAITSIISTADKIMAKSFNKLAESRVIRRQLDLGAREPIKFAATMFVTSIVSKDVVGCILYTTQSLHNKKIPKGKRKFVAALDLMNGIIMVGGQFLISKVINAKMVPRLKSKFTGILKDSKTGIERTVNSDAVFHPDNLRKIILEEAGKLKMKVDSESVEKTIKMIAKDSRDPFLRGFGILIAAIATTALTKRVTAPLLATPLAGWFKEKFMDKPKKHKKTSVNMEHKKIEKKKVETPKELDARLLSHEVAPWNYSNKEGSSVTLNKITTK